MKKYTRITAVLVLGGLLADAEQQKERILDRNLPKVLHLRRQGLRKMRFPD